MRWPSGSAPSPLSIESRNSNQARALRDTTRSPLICPTFQRVSSLKRSVSSPRGSRCLISVFAAARPSEHTMEWMGLCCVKFLTDAVMHSSKAKQSNAETASSGRTSSSANVKIE